MNQATRTITKPIDQRVIEEIRPGEVRPERRASPPRVYAIDLTRSRRSAPHALMSWIADAGFDTLLLSLPRHFGTADVAVLPPIVEMAARSGLRVHLDLVLHVAGESSPSVKRHPDWYRPAGQRAADPREVPPPPGTHLVNPRTPAFVEGFSEYWGWYLRGLGEAGISGFRCKPNAAIPPLVWRALIAAAPGFRFAVWTPGMPAADVMKLPRGCFDVTYNSLAWWDFGAGWLREEIARLGKIAPVGSSVGLPTVPAHATTPRAARRLLDVAAGNGHGLLLPMGFEFGLHSDLTHPKHGADDWRRLRENAWLDLTFAVRDANRRLAARRVPVPLPQLLSSPEADAAVLFAP